MVFFPKSLSYLNPACMVEVDGNRTRGGLALLCSRIDGGLGGPSSSPLALQVCAMFFGPFPYFAVCLLHWENPSSKFRVNPLFLP